MTHEIRRIPLTSKKTKEQGMIYIDPLYRRDGTGITDVVIHYVADGESILDTDQPGKKSQFIGALKYPETVASVAEKVQATLQKMV